MPKAARAVRRPALFLGRPRPSHAEPLPANEPLGTGLHRWGSPDRPVVVLQGVALQNEHEGESASMAYTSPGLGTNTTEKASVSM